ncbi:site-specific integrase [Gracilibacillus salinarum]|uniref:Site-specific integrase n=1 Tax=Gracilibacillus salinarum TaxID=2932255 RepID=A0ABY4GNU2_9BACI|nr:site-specific integrase [Gracilibacillus salinarum]UOQ85655.1 site-specific integrase [Gracilibacillus salinarum]
MGISYRKHNGSWEYRIKYQDPITKKYKEKSKRGFKTKPEARFEAQEVEDQLLNNFELASQNITLKEFLNNWLEEYKNGVVRKNTFDLHKRNIEKQIIPYFKSIDMKSLKPTMYQQFLNSLHDKEYSKRTIEIVHGTMRNAMEKALQLNMIDHNPTIGAVIKGKEKERQIKFIDSTEIPTFLKTSFQYGYTFWFYFSFMIDTGMRKGEVAALQWSDINFKEKTISVNKTLDFQAESDEELFGDPKTFRSKRTISITNNTINQLKDHLKWQNKNKQNLNDIYRHDLNLVFCRDDGYIMPKSSLFNAFRRILKQAGISNLPIHSLRHTHAVLLLESGTDMKFIQERLGHGSYQVTADVYSHISKRLDEKSMAKYEYYFNQITFSNDD